MAAGVQKLKGLSCEGDFYCVYFGPVCSATGTKHPTRALPACGDLSAEMSVGLDKSVQTPVAPQPDKALVYFVQEIGPWFNWT
jgi:hypothetical protein